MLFICQPAQLGIKFGADPPSLYKLLEHLLYLRILRFYCAAFQFGNNLFPSAYYRICLRSYLVVPASNLVSVHDAIVLSGKFH